MMRRSFPSRMAFGAVTGVAALVLAVPGIAVAAGSLGSLGSSEGPAEPASDGGYSGNVIHRSHTVTLPAGAGDTDIPVTCTDGEFADGDNQDVGLDYVATGGGFVARDSDVHVGINRNLIGLNGDYETYNGKGWLIQARNDSSKDVEVTANVVCIYAPNDDPSD